MTLGPGRCVRWTVPRLCQEGVPVTRVFSIRPTQVCRNCGLGEVVYSISFCALTREASMSRALHTRLSLCGIVVTGLLFLTGSGAFAETCDAPNPDFPISAPPPTVRPDTAAFSGVWAGTWLLWGVGIGNRVLQCARIHVSVEDSHSAAVAYCYGSRSDVGTKPQCDRYRAIIRGPYLIFVTSIGINISMRLRDPGTAEATAAFPAGQPSVITDFQKL